MNVRLPIADLYAIESHLSNEIKKLEMAGHMDDDYWKLRGKRDSISLILRVRIEKLLKEYK